MYKLPKNFNLKSFKDDISDDIYLSKLEYNADNEVSRVHLKLYLKEEEDGSIEIELPLYVYEKYIDQDMDKPTI